MGEKQRKRHEEYELVLLQLYVLFIIKDYFIFLSLYFLINLLLPS